MQEWTHKIRLAARRFHPARWAAIVVAAQGWLIAHEHNGLIERIAELLDVSVTQTIAGMGTLAGGLAWLAGTRSERLPGMKQRKADKADAAHWQAENAKADEEARVGALVAAKLAELGIVDASADESADIG